MPTSPTQTDVLVIGAGPSGAAASYWLARSGYSVVLVDKSAFPRDTSCGGALTPRSVQQLIDMGLSAQLETFHTVDGVRLCSAGRTIELPWPSHDVFGNVGKVVDRGRLDSIVAQHAVAEGAVLLDRHEALQPIVERGFVRGAVVQAGGEEPIELRATYVVVADGANSRFGRALGTFRTREWPYATAICGLWKSSASADRWLESHLGIDDRNGNAIPGFGWVFPVGDGTISVGLGLLSTFREFKGINSAHLLESFIHQQADRLEIDPQDSVDRPISGRIPMGCSVGPAAGPSYLVVGDAAGSVSPFNGDGIAAAFETGRLAADVIARALKEGQAAILQQFPRLVDQEFGQHFHVGRLFARAVGRPTVMRQLTRVGMSSPSVMSSMFRIQSNMLRANQTGPAEVAFATAAALSKLAPNA